MSVLDAMVAGELEPGIYRYLGEEQSAGSWDDLLADHGWRHYHLDGRLITDKQSLLQVLAEALGFPGYVGRNWDALEEAIRDLAWAPGAGHLLTYDYPQILAAYQPRDWQMLLSILQTAVDSWRAEGISMFVLLGRTEAGLAGIPSLP